MGQPETSAPGPANPPEERTCRRCNQTKVLSPESWPYKKDRDKVYKAHGNSCLECEKKRKKDYEIRRDGIAALVADIPAVPIRAHTADKEKQRAAVYESKLDVAKALKAGARTLNEYAPSVLARVLEYAEDPDSDHHQWALELLAQRILPRKLFEELGGQAAGVGAIGDRRPQFTINILPSGAGGHPDQQATGRVLGSDDGARVRLVDGSDDGEAG